MQKKYNGFKKLKFKVKKREKKKREKTPQNCKTLNVEAEVCDNNKKCD